MDFADAGNGPAAVAETHVSWVFFVGDKAYKLKKPVRLDFIDLSTRERRLACCEREVELNRRLAPDVYLGVSNVLGVDGGLCDHLVVMRRMPEEARLSRLVADGKPVEDELLEIARTMARFHADAPVYCGLDGEALAGADELRRRWDANLAVLATFGSNLSGGRAVPRITDLSHRFLAGRAGLFAARVAGGRVREGHGDLLADDIFCLPDGPRLLDCLEFDDALRRGDGLADIAFLAMDLERLERPDLGARLLEDYREQAGDSWPEALAHHYIAYRALIRAKVAALRAEQAGGAPRWRPVRQLAGICLDHLEKAAVRLVLVGGLPGTGKSTVAQGVASELGYALLRSDVVRKERFGLDPGARAAAPFNEGLYSPGVSAATYHAMLERARLALQMGRSVVLDATWSDREQRQAAHTLASATSSDVVELRCTLPTRLAAARIRARASDSDDPSDATEEVAAELAARFAPWPGATTLSTAGTPRAVLDDALRAIRHAAL